MTMMLPDGRRLGAHLAMGDGMVKAGERAVEIGATAIQIFSDNPTAWDRRTAASPEIPAFRAVLSSHGIAPLAIHGAYLINLAGDDEGFRSQSVGLLSAELATARWFGARIVNIHMGSHRGAGVDAGIDRLVGGLLAALASEASEEIGPDPGPTITLENSAGGGGGLGVDLDELAAIAAALDRAGVPRGRVGFCIDTAHLWGAGTDIADPAVVDGVIREFDRRIGIDRLPLVHLNDTKAERGSRMDRHEHLGAGRIGRDGLAAFLRNPLLANTAFVIETPGMEEGYDQINLRRAEAIARGNPLDALPEGALTLRGSRARAATPPGDGSDATPRRRRRSTPGLVPPEPTADRS
jgi:deoxyribonuclease-4